MLPNRFGFYQILNSRIWFFCSFIWYVINTVMNTLVVNSASKTKQDSSHLQRQVLEWISRYQHEFTHAITFTFNERKVWSFIRASKQLSTPHDERMLELLRKTMFLFKRNIDRGLYGNTSKRHGARLLFVPVLEGLGVGQFPHYHAAMGVDNERSKQLGEIVRLSWSKLPFAGHQIKLTPYRDQGWLSYMTKHVQKLNKHAIDWDSVSIPSRSLATC